MDTLTDGIIARRQMADVLSGLVSRSGVSARLTALAVVMVRIGFADEELARVARAVASVHQLDDLAGSLHGWRSSGELSVDESAAVWYAIVTLQVAAAESRWLMAHGG